MSIEDHTADTPTKDLGLTKKGTPRKRAYKADRKSAPKVEPSFNEQKAIELAKKGVSQGDIAKVTGVTQPTISRFLEKVGEDSRHINLFRELRADSFAFIQGKAVQMQARVIDSFNDMDDTEFARIPASTKGSLLDISARVAGIAYDKERLELNKSTANINTLATIIESAHDDKKNEKAA
ncbi:MAG: hypothetical protein KAR06_04315 [Deltaproteobacteria bacterium]|nr:hypothetical protein [Deltaproteobacteria bacterium]